MDSAFLAGMRPLDLMWPRPISVAPLDLDEIGLARGPLHPFRPRHADLTQLLGPIGIRLKQDVKDRKIGTSGRRIKGLL